jgi:hypothetical protein
MLPRLLGGGRSLALLLLLLLVAAGGDSRRSLEHQQKLLGFWLVPGAAASPRADACQPPLINISGFVFDWSSMDAATATAMAQCGAAGVKNFLRLDLGPYKGARRFPTIETPYMYHSPEANPSPSGCPPYSPFPHNDWATQPPVCCGVPNGTRCGSGTSPCCNTAAQSAQLEDYGIPLRPNAIEGGRDGIRYGFGDVTRSVLSDSACQPARLCNSIHSFVLYT